MKNQPRLLKMYKDRTGSKWGILPPMPDVRRQCAWCRERVQGGFAK